MERHPAPIGSPRKGFLKWNLLKSSYSSSYVKVCTLCSSNRVARLSDSYEADVQLSIYLLGGLRIPGNTVLLTHNMSLAVLWHSRHHDSSNHVFEPRPPDHVLDVDLLKCRFEIKSWASIWGIFALASATWGSSHFILQYHWFFQAFFSGKDPAGFYPTTDPLLTCRTRAMELIKWVHSSICILSDSAKVRININTCSKRVHRLAQQCCWKNKQVVVVKGEGCSAHAWCYSISTHARTPHLKT